MATITTTELSGATSFIRFGQSVFDNLPAYTIIAYCRPQSAGGGATSKTLYVKTPSGSFRGPRMWVRHNSGAPQIAMGGDSASQGNPSTTAIGIANAVTYGAWQHLEGTWNGALTDNAVNVYVNGTRAQSGDAAGAGGPVPSDAANDAYLLNTPTMDFGFSGDVAYIAVWNRVLNSTERTTVRTDGPLEVPDGLVLCWANGQDYSANALTPTSRSTFAAGALPPVTALGGAAGTTPVAFTGTVPAQSWPEDSAITPLDLSAYFSGDLTPFSYAVTTGTLPTGLSLNSATGVISGTPTTPASAVSIVVTATDTGSNTAATNAFNVTITAAAVAPDVAPGSTSATAAGSSQINLAWAAVSGATGYDVERDGEGSPVDVGNVLAYSHTGLAAESTHSYRVRAYNAAGDGPWSASFGATTSAASASIAFGARFDGENINRSLSPITSADSSTPAITIKPRLTSTTDYHGSAQWGMFCFQLTNAAGKRPAFTLDATNWTGSWSARKHLSATYWRPWYSYDGINWTRWDTAVSNPSGTTWTFQLSTAFTGDVYVAFSPNYPVSRIPTLIDWCDTNAPSYIQRLRSADNPDCIYATVAAQTDEAGGTVPSQPMYAFGIWDRTAFPDDGLPKRTVVLSSGLHGYEVLGNWALEGAVKFLCSSDAVAVALRKQYQFLIYPMLNPSGRWGGHYRGQWQSGQGAHDTNRDWDDTPGFETTQATITAFDLDFENRTVVFAMDIHSADVLYSVSDAFLTAGYYVAGEPALPAPYKSAFSAALLTQFSAAVVEDGGTTPTLRKFIYDRYGNGHCSTPEVCHQFNHANQDAILLYGEKFMRALAALQTAQPAQLAYQGKYVALDFGNAPAAGAASASLWTGVPGHGGTLLSADKLGVNSAGAFRIDANAVSGSTAFLLLTDEDESAGITRTFGATVTPGVA